METIYAIGDIHGRYDKLCALMDKIDIDLDSEMLVFLGDYIDRGPQSFEVVDYLIDLRKRHPNTVFLKGNHEEMFEKYISGEDRLTYLFNGGQQTLDSYMSRSRETDEPLIPAQHLAFFKSLMMYYETENYIFVHAGLQKNVPLAKQKSEDLLWIRKKFIESGHDFGKPVVFGHTPLPEPLLQPNKIGIDTGAVYGNKLTCIRLPDLVFYSA
ncbi:MAG: metallophosphatase [Deltaproteobacteria bacterium SG8_13]|nr:MAG: metallophosphatase [Deltaproteobacteria bacterium SG8_13]